ncbi:toll/interleukin-1 receptor domain-containing protein [Streptomyces sp. NPDC050803]|uniref:toll/interleukin-1 receptor domain-containing protein n=1 Tax=unclassified Streptomyces TaxID=2593676 RepID=UPI00342236BA
MTNLPPLAAPFLGRDDEIEDTHRLLMEHRAVLVHDPKKRPHGYGTSQLALGYGLRYTRHYEVAWRFDCGGEPEPEELAARLAAELDRLRERYEEVLKVPLAEPSVATWLYIYDNVAKPDAVRQHFPAGNARVLVASRHTGSWDPKARVCVGPLTPDDTVGLLRQVAELEPPQAERLAGFFEGHPKQIVRVGEAVRAGVATVEQFVALTGIARMAPPPAEPSPPVPQLPGQRQAEVSDRTSLRTNILQSVVCLNNDRFRRWITALRAHTGALLDDKLVVELSMGERVDQVLDLAFQEPKPLLLRALADTLMTETVEFGDGWDQASNVRQIVDKLAERWPGAPQTPSATPAAEVSCYFFTSWLNRESYSAKVRRFHRMVARQVADRLGIPEADAGFFDQTTQHGAQWQPRMIEAIRTTRVLVPLITKDYFHSTWCRREWAVMKHRIDSVNAAPGQEPVAIMPVFWIRPTSRSWKIPKDFEPYQHFVLGDEQEALRADVYDLMEDHKAEKLQDFVTHFAKAMVALADTQLPHLDRDAVLDLPLAFADVNPRGR